MGAGKTTLAEEVAARLGRRAVDADRLLEGRAQISISAFFAQRGETEFRVAEAAVALELARAAREKFGGDSLGDFVGAWRAYLGRIAWTAR